MKKITRIEIENYRAFFGSYRIDLPKGENLLVYGENGSGKSSLFKALNNYLTSSRNPDFPFVKNHYRPTADNGELRMTFSDADPITHLSIAGTDQTLSFGSAASTHNVNYVMDAELIKGFLDYRNLLDVYFNDKPKPNLFNLISLKILGKQFNTARTFRFGEKWKKLQEDLIDKPYTSRDWIHRDALAELPTYEAELRQTLRNVFRYLNNTLLRTYFNELNIELRFDLQPIVFNYARHRWDWYTTADLRLSLIQNGAPVPNDYNDFLNEARLSAFAVCIYLAALKTNPELFDYKILFLDDVFIGLDTSNRFPILKIIQQEFTEHQIFVTTYDRHLYELAKRKFEIETSGKWKTAEFYVDHDIIGIQRYEAPIIVKGETHLENGIKYLNDREKPDYPAASNYFRKALEEVIQEETCMPKYELTDAESTQIPDHKLNKLVLATKNFLNKTGNSEEYINQIAGIITALLHPLSHHEIKSPVYKRELQIAQNSIPKLKEQLSNINHAANFKCMLEFKKHLKLSFTINGGAGHFIYYELITEENLLKKNNAAALPTVLTCRCRTAQCYGINGATPLAAVTIPKTATRFHYTSLLNAYDTIHAFLVTQNGAFPKEANYLDAIMYHDGTNWQPINNILPW
jgi:energy-coupling factor transporter ATP-binding protein EcfA2